MSRQEFGIRVPPPEQNLVLKCKGLQYFPLDKEAGLAQYAKWPSVITRYIPSKNYSGLELPEGTKEVLHVALLEHPLTHAFRVVNHFVSFVDTEYTGGAISIYHEFRRHAENGYHAFFQRWGWDTSGEPIFTPITTQVLPAKEDLYNAIQAELLENFK